MTSREIIRFNGAPVRLRLDEAPGEGRKSKSTKSGAIEFQYAANDNAAIFYLTQSGRDELLKSGAQAGDEVAIHKLAKDRWAIAVLSDAAEPANAPAPEPAPPKQVHWEQEEHALPPRTKRAPFPPSSYYQPTPQLDSPLPITNGHGRINGNGHSHQPSVISPQPKAESPTAQHLGACMKLAIDACLIAQEYAHEKNFGLTFLGGDIKSIALSIYINDQQGGKR